jgi:hypothetical protein
MINKRGHRTLARKIKLNTEKGEDKQGPSGAHTALHLQDYTKSF